MSQNSHLSFATVDPTTLSAQNPGRLAHLVGGEWIESPNWLDVHDPMNGEVFLQAPNPTVDELQPFVDSLKACPKSGMHNPLKNVERYRMYGDVTFRVAAAMREKEVEDFFTRLIQRVMPKSDVQARGEVTVTRAFLENFCGDQVRFLARGFSNPGDHHGQQSNGYRWPFGPVALICPFNFPLEIPVLQLMGALYMGNKPVVKGSETTSVVLEQFVRLLIACGMPPSDLDLIHAEGRVMGELVERAPIRNIQFTGSSEVAELLSKQTHGKVRIEDAGFDWKILGPDATADRVEYVAWQSDQDAYAASGQKCSAQSILFAHENWISLELLDRIQELAARRKVDDLTLGPVLTVSTERMATHTQNLLAIPGARVLFGGKPLEGQSFYEKCGAFEPTAIFVPLDEILKDENFELVTTEIFGPFQIVTSWNDATEHKVLEACERMDHHLTAAVVSNDIHFVQRVLSHTVNGTTYAGLRARTTGAPQNHWFGPAGDPRGAGIGTPEAIQLVWSCHREIIEDFGPIPNGWSLPQPS